MRQPHSPRFVPAATPASLGAARQPMYVAFQIAGIANPLQTRTQPRFGLPC